MAILAGGTSAGYSRTIEKFLLLRMIISTLVVGAGVMIVQLTDKGFPVRPLYALLVLSCVIGGFCYIAVRFGLRERMALWLIMIADIFFETAIVHFSGGITSPFALIFCLSIVAAAFLLEVTGGLGIAFLASCSYVAYVTLQSANVFSLPEARSLGASFGEPVRTYLLVSIFFLVGSVSGYLAERLKRKGKQLETAETELMQLKINTDSILENMSSGVLVVDSSGKIVTINHAAGEILKLNREEIQSKNLREVFDPVMPELASELAYALDAEKSKFRHELTVKNHEGTSIPLGISISLLKNNGQKRGVIAVFQDLTEVREMQEKVRKADRLAAIGELSAGIAHEIRNPLASISGSIEMLYNDLDLGGEHRRLMELVMRESDRLDRIINDFLEFAKMRPPTLRDVSVEKCIEDVLVLLKNNLAVSKGIKIETSQHGGSMWVRADEEQMRQVFLNLSLNACEAMGKGGRLRVEPGISGPGEVGISFQDEGCGIEESARDHLFQPFFTTKEGGTGLGLAIANKIVEAHGGRINHRNREGGGAEFIVILPLKYIEESADHREPLGKMTRTS